MTDPETAPYLPGTERPGDSMLRNTEMLLREYDVFTMPSSWDAEWVRKQLDPKFKPAETVKLRDGYTLYTERLPRK